MKRALFVLLFAAATSSYAAPSSIAVVATGDCTNYPLTRATTEFVEALKRQPNVRVVEAEAAMVKLGRQEGRSVQEVQRQIVVAEDHFYRGQYAKLSEQLDLAFAEISRLPPGRARWELFASAWNLEALARSRIKKRGSLEDAYLHILRLDPTYKLDPDYVAPSMIKVFEQTRKELARAPRHRVTLTTVPAGASIFVDGKGITGKVTPATLDLPQGEYSIAFSKGDKLSFPRPLKLPEMTEAFVDLGFEGAVEVGRVICIAGTSEEKDRLDRASLLASVLEANQVILLRLEQVKGQPAWLTATAVVGAAKARDGGLELNEKLGISDEAMTALARFSVTGELSGVVKPAPEAVSGTGPAVAATAPVGAPAQPSAAEAGEGGATPVTVSQDAAGWQRTTGMVVGGAGAASVAAGVAFFLMAADAQAKFTALEEGGITPDEAAQARRLLDSAGQYGTFGWVGLGLGAAAAGAGGWLYFTAPQDGGAAGTSVSVIPGPGGGALLVRGSW